MTLKPSKKELDTLSGDSTSSRHGWGAAILMALLLFGFAAEAAWQHRVEQGPEIPAKVVDGSFDLASATQILERVFGEETSHPAGTAENDQVREAIVELVREWGYEPEIQHCFGTASRWWEEWRDKQVPLENISFRLRGTAAESDRRTIAIVSHYDSTPFGPGICDDALGTAVLLEIAKQMAASNPPQNDILFLITDGEEYGLLGAREYAKDPEMVESIDMVVNLEARGTRGRSLMFQTSPNNLALIRVLSESLPHPATSSLFIEIYKTMPNDTDLTVFLKAGRQGYNFAFVGGGENYHTPNDDLQHYSRNTFFHQGENATELIRALANVPFDRNPVGDAVYFDVWGMRILYWPVYVSWMWAVGCGAVFLGLFFVNRRRDEAKRISLVRSLLLTFGNMAIVFFICLLLVLALQFDRVSEMVWPQNGVWIVVGIWLAGLSASLVGRAWLLRDNDPALGVWGPAGLWVFLAAVSAVFAPGASYLFLSPTTAFMVPLAMMVARPLCNASFATTLTILVWGVIWLALEFLFFQAFGLRGLPVLAARMGLFGSLMFAFGSGLRRDTALTHAGVLVTASMVALGVGIWLCRSELAL
ncbi:MAG: M28 family peptidase [Pirellulaceae bacterium]